ncbi:unnamed protein product [Ranitomeya imitator]|uniref:Uncharacterized protein n=1 Tax=Ranitomeya imitator TaxID=111125 RepID=A0ABN9L771_9NEOB|nr:unnamed protein product [Ranitomeya imitator]
MAVESWVLTQAGFFQEVIYTMISARKPTSMRINHRIWKTTFSWCKDRGCSPLEFSIPSILEFLQSGLDLGLALSSLKGQISALSVLFQRRIANRLQVKTFIQGVSHVVPPYKMPLEPWDLNLVLRVLQEAPFEPLQEVSLSFLSWKVTFLVVVTSIRRVSELAALSCQVPFLIFHQDKVVLRTSPFTPSQKGLRLILLDTPVLLAELRPAREPLYDWKSSCETWSVEFSPDGSWFAWSQGHGIIKLIPWPLEVEEPSPSHRHKSQRYKGSEVKRKGSLKEKILDCGQIVWSLTFGSSSAPAGWKLWPLSRQQDIKSSETWLLLATGLSDGHIKVWEVHTGRLLFNLSGHQDVVRDLSFTKNGSLTLVTASRDKTLRIWDLKKDEILACTV